MKQIIYLLTFLSVTSCHHSNTNKKQDTSIVKTNKPEHTINQLPNHPNQELNAEFKEYSSYKLSDTITADFNGDGKLDQAVFENNNLTSGIIIHHGGSGTNVVIGFGEPFAHLTDFNWVDYWGLVYDSETYEIVIEDNNSINDRRVKLDHPSIVVRKEEVGGGLITFKDGKYVWIHQSD